MSENCIQKDKSIREALKRINALLGMTLFVVDENKVVLGTITDGDIRRYLINDGEISDSLEKIMSTNFTFLSESDLKIEEFSKLREKSIRYVPLLDDKGCLVKTIDLEKQKSLLPLEAVLMAGGKGTRLRPMTLTTPKPLLEVGGKPIIEYNIDRLIEFGVQKIYISVNYLKDQLKDYFGDGSSKGIKIEYIEETEITGTLGSATYIENYTTEQILVMNSDLLTNIDFEDLFIQHSKLASEMTVATVPYKVSIPYGIVETKNQMVQSIIEKPTYTYYSNAGIYIINSTCLKEIPQKKFYNATDLIEKLIEEKRKVSNYPILSYWLDIGKPIDFEKAQEDVKHIDF
jgi:dTDP-glucose pyrophosphorylase